MSNLTVFIDEETINRALSCCGQISGVETVHAKSMGLKATLQWSIRHMSVLIEKDKVRFKAEVRIKSSRFSYTDPVEGIFRLSIEENALLFHLEKVMATLYVKPLGKRINLRTFDISGKLPDRVRNMRFELPFKKEVHFKVPKGGDVTFGTKDIDLRIKDGKIVVSAELDVI
mgnify:CR=1 FL=1